MTKNRETSTNTLRIDTERKKRENRQSRKLKRKFEDNTNKIRLLANYKSTQ